MPLSAPILSCERRRSLPAGAGFPTRLPAASLGHGGPAAPAGLALGSASRGGKGPLRKHCGGRPGCCRPALTAPGCAHGGDGHREPHPLCSLSWLSSRCPARGRAAKAEAGLGRWWRAAAGQPVRRAVQTAPQGPGGPRGSTVGGGGQGDEPLSPTETCVRVATRRRICVPLKGWRGGQERQLMMPHIWINFSFAFYSFQSATE